MQPRLYFNPPVIAHRGARAVVPENTLAAIRHSREEGVNWIELDVKITYDGVPVLMHDETLDRTTDSTGVVAQKTWDEIAELDVGKKFDPKYKGETVPHFSDAVNVLLQNNLSLIVEIKPCPGRSKATTMVTMIELSKIWPEGASYPVISSFDTESLAMAAQLEPHWPRCLILAQNDPDWKEKVLEVGASLLNIEESLLTEEKVKEYQSARLPLIAYTVNDPVRAKELLAWGVQAVYADNPRLILDEL